MLLVIMVMVVSIVMVIVCDGDSGDIMVVIRD
jgi:hypothetical protein